MATMTINTTGAEDARLTVAFGKYLGLPGNANAAQIKGAVVAFLTNTVTGTEFQTQEQAIVIVPIAPT